MSGHYVCQTVTSAIENNKMSYKGRFCGALQATLRTLDPGKALHLWSVFREVSDVEAHAASVLPDLGAVILPKKVPPRWRHG